MKDKKSNNQAFTLIELSIVLVIIGLLAGGVLVGQDLIKAAEIRSTIGQYEKYNTAVNTFRLKYNALPGDMLRADANAFGLCADAGCPAVADPRGLGDGNWKLEAFVNNNMHDGELLAFWQQLSKANMIDGSYGSTIDTDYYPTETSADLHLPKAKIGGGIHWQVGSASSGAINYFALLGITDISTGGFPQFSEGMTPLQAFTIDSKVDDGKPNTGTIQQRQTTQMFYYASFYDAKSAAAFNDGGFTPFGSVNQEICTIGSVVSATSVTPSNIYNTAVSGSPRVCELILKFN